MTAHGACCLWCVNSGGKGLQEEMDGNLQEPALLLKPNLRFGPFEFDPRRHELHRSGERIQMSASQLRLLTLFLERPGELITREQIAQRLWADTRTIDVASGIKTAVNRLRRQLQKAPGEPTYIETVIGLGYRFLPELDKSEKVEPVGPETGQVPASSPIFNGRTVPQAPATMAAEYPEAVEPQANPARRAPAAPLSTRWMAALCGLALLSVLTLYRLHRRTVFRAAQTTDIVLATSAAERKPLIPVTAEENVGQLTVAAVAPSGKSVAYADRFGVSVHWFSSGMERLLGVRPLFTVDRLAWMPDESGLLMSGTDEILHRQQVWFVPLQGAYLRPLVPDGDRATMSPDGRLIAFTRSKDQELWLADADGQHPRPLRSAAADESFGLILWSPAGNRMLATLRKKSSEAGSAGNLAVAFAAGKGAYECIDPGSGQILAREEGFFADSGYLLPNGRFYFAENKTPGPTTGTADLMVVATDLSSGRFLGAPQHVRDLDGRFAASLTASSSGERFAAVLDRSETDVYVANLRQPGPEFTDVVRLTRGVRQNLPHSWTADGKGVLLENDSLTPTGSPTKWAIFNQPLDGSKPALIASLPGTAAMAQLSPDGRSILFLQFTGHPQHASGIFRISAAGGRIEQVPTHGEIEEFHCSTSSNGRCVAREVMGNEALVYYALDPVQGIGPELGRTPWQPNRLGDWSLSADGSTVAAASHDTLHPGIGLIKLGVQPTQVQDIPVPGHGTTLGASWAPDDQSLFVECKTETGFALLSLDLVGRLKLLRQNPSLIWAVPSRDGKKVAFPGLTLSSRVWASNVAP